MNHVRVHCTLFNCSLVLNVVRQFLRVNWLVSVAAITLVHTPLVWILKVLVYYSMFRWYLLHCQFVCTRFSLLRSLYHMHMCVCVSLCACVFKYGTGKWLFTDWTLLNRQEHLNVSLMFVQLKITTMPKQWWKPSKRVFFIFINQIEYFPLFNWSK